MNNKIKPGLAPGPTMADAIDPDKSAKLHALAAQNKRQKEGVQAKYEKEVMIKKINFLESFFKKSPGPQYIKVFGLEQWLQYRPAKCYAFLPTKNRYVFLVKRLS